MKPGDSYPKLSNQSQAGKTAGLKDEHTKGAQPNDAMYARLRRLEQRVNAIESKVATTQRDCWRIEKRFQRTNPPGAEDDKVGEKFAGLPPALFGGN